MTKHAFNEASPSTCKAYCWATGKIEFGESCPDGALFLVEDEEDTVRRTCMALARLAYDNVTLLVPGVPEAPDENAAVAAVLEFRSLLEQRL
jgi:hypothetical protein